MTGGFWGAMAALVLQSPAPELAAARDLDGVFFFGKGGKKTIFEWGFTM